jgi:poly(3-hydroxybutyrate) depolymerase
MATSMNLYPAYQAHADLLAPWRTLAMLSAPALEAGSGGPARAPWPLRSLAAACRVIELSTVTHRRPAWGLRAVDADGQPLALQEQVVRRTPFGTLLRFAKPGAPAQPRMLVVAPMSGHFATLLRDTVQTALQDHDVHVTDWHNVRDVSLSAGEFGLDEYVEHIVEFIAAMGEGVHIVAVCQPCVAALAAVALMSEDGHPATPASLTLMAGPIDCRINPTAVNRLATARPIEWFRSRLISRVPWRYRGAGRRVYPGFVQLAAFMNMNRERHAEAFKSYYRHLVDGQAEQAEAIRAFYEEYLAVADLSADFYLQTVAEVFQRHSLPRGELRWRGRRVDPGAIRRTALLTIEGERDDICAVGQTLAAQDLARSLRPHQRTHHVQTGVGHYGVFSGRRWQRHVYPLVRDVVHLSA